MNSAKPRIDPAHGAAFDSNVPARLPRDFEIAGYVVDGWLRDGGMAAIYRAHRRSDGHRVALKLQLLSTAHVPEICERFDIEAESMQLLSGSRHVIELFDVGVLNDGRRFVVMEWVEGENLEEVLDFLRNQDERISPVRACEIGMQVATGLAAVHSHGLVHCDLKPANIMVTAGEEHQDLITIVDFGIVTEVGVAASQTPGVDVMGTRAYMAPEHALGHAAEPTFDLYALGVVLYEAITGTPVPPDGWTPESLPTIDSRRRGMPKALTQVVHTCIRTDPRSRPKTASGLALALAEIRARLQPDPAASELSREQSKPTASTELPPRSQLPQAEQPPARTGETEVSLTHEEVLGAASFRATVVTPAISAAPEHHSEPPPSPAPAAADHPSDSSQAANSSAALAPDSAPVPAAAPRHGETVVGPPPSAESTIAPLASAPPDPLLYSSDSVVAAVATPPPDPLLYSTDSTIAPTAAEWSTEPPVEPEPTRKRWLLAAFGGATVLGLAAWFLVGSAVDDPPTTIAAADAPATANEGPAPLDRSRPSPAVPPNASAPAPSAIADAEDVPEEPEFAAPQAEPLPPTKAATPRRSSKGGRSPSKAECEAKRNEATAAKKDRQWSMVLRATSTRSCWSGKAQRLSRRGLRVEAFAELGQFAKCVREGGSSSDKQVSARVRYCKKKLP